MREDKVVNDTGEKYSPTAENHSGKKHTTKGNQPFDAISL